MTSTWFFKTDSKNKNVQKQVKQLEAGIVAPSYKEARNIALSLINVRREDLLLRFGIHRKF